MNPPPAPPFHPPVPPAPKKGLSPLAWTGIGCGTLLLIVLALTVGAGILAVKKVKEFAANPEKAAAELIVRANPELEKISSDDKTGVITVRTKKGETLTLNYKDVADGKISFTDSSGVETRIGGGQNIDDVPAWVPRAPKTTNVTSVFTNVTGGKASGLYVSETSADRDEIEQFFKDEADRLGLEYTSQTSTTINSTSILNHSYTGDTRDLTINFSSGEGTKNIVSVTYREK